MTREEFEQRTGYFPTLEMYKIIEYHYMESQNDKDVFCKAYQSNEFGLAEKIRYEADMQAMRERKKMECTIEVYEKKIQKLEADLECEQEWRPYEDRDNVSQYDYLNLSREGGTKRLTDEEAKEILYHWYGFAKDKVTILYSVPKQEKNRHNCVRDIGEIERLPLYNATDWNYIRFDCGCMSYELYNDNLRLFMH